jgi:hypothetical protein
VCGVQAVRKSPNPNKDGRPFRYDTSCANKVIVEAPKRLPVPVGGEHGPECSLEVLMALRQRIVQGIRSGNGNTIALTDTVVFNAGVCGASTT